MYVNDNSDTHGAVHNDPRVTPSGKILRMSHIDEFPLFLQVLSGSMSTVGPRPHVLLHTDEYSAQVDNFMEGHEAKSSIAGWVQVNGCRGQIKDLEDMKVRVNADIWYIYQWSLWVDS